MHARHTLLSLAVLAALSGTAMADSSTVNTAQNGSENALSVDQQGATGSRVDITQTGVRNGAGSVSNNTPISQTATYSTLTIN